MHLITIAMDAWSVILFYTLLFLLALRSVRCLGTYDYSAWICTHSALNSQARTWLPLPSFAVGSTSEHHGRPLLSRQALVMLKTDVC